MRRLWVLLLLCSACFTRTIAERMGVSGWFSIDEQGAFAPLPLADADFNCARLTQRDETRPILVLVHGVNGDGDEWSKDATPLLLASQPAAVFMLRWVPYDGRDAIAQRLGSGVTHLAACLPHAAGRIIVLSHSAGGVMSSFAASLMQGPQGAPDGWVTVLTVASPLAGTVKRQGNKDGAEEATVMLDLGSSIAAYPSAAPGVRVLHLRTQYPADTVMKPSAGLVPNDPAIGVPGAPQVNLPETLNHMTALHYAAERVADGTWTQWIPAP